MPAGHRLDLPVPLAELSCPAAAATTPIVELTILRGGGEQRLELAPSDPFGQLARLHEDGCFAVSLARLGELRIVDFSAPLDATEPAGLVFDAAARGDSGYTVTGVRSTTLISPAPDGVGRDEVPLAWRVGSPETSWTLAFVPTRCDPHAVLEDKQGTLIPFSAQRDDGVEGRLVVAAPEPVRTRIFEYVARFCGFAP